MSHTIYTKEFHNANIRKYLYSDMRLHEVRVIRLLNISKLVNGRARIQKFEKICQLQILCV